MRILFSALPALGHLLPMLPLAAAARAAGHDTAVLNHPTMREVLAPLPVLPAGPTIAEMAAEHYRRHGFTRPDDVTAQKAALFMAGTRVDLTLDEAVAAARGWAPELVVADPLDAVGPVAAAVLGVPWVLHAFGALSPQLLGSAPSEAFTGLIEEVLASRYADLGVVPTTRLAYVDPCPDVLQSEHWAPPADRVPIRTGPYLGTGPAWDRPAFPGREDRPLVLVTLGTTTLESLGDAAVLRGMLASLSSVDVNVVVTLGAAAKALEVDLDLDRVLPVDFVPLAQLLEGVDVVVSVGGSGTVLGALSRGVPLVLHPVIAEQPWNAVRPAALGAAVVIDSVEDTGAAVQQVLGTPSYRRAAAAVAGAFARMPGPEEVVDVLVGAVS